MYKLLIVDDETTILEGLKSFDWAALGIEISGTCTNGLMALQWLESNPVDIILSDLKMPIMDGIELSGRIKDSYPFIYTVILSGYDDYELIRESMKSGVFDYLLKPVQLDELFNVFQKLLEDLKKSKQHQIKIRLLEKKARFATKYLKNQFLKELLSSPLSEERIEEGCTYGELVFESSCYTVCSFGIDSHTAAKNFYDEQDWQLILFAFDNILSELCETLELGYLWVNPENGICNIIITNEKIQSDSEKLSKTLNELKNGLYKAGGLFRSTLSCGVGTKCCKVQDIYLSSKNAMAVLSSTHPDDSITFFTDLNIKAAECPDMPKSSPEEFNEETEKPLNKCSRDHIITKAIQFIKSNFTKSITLNDVADSVYVSPVYLSNIFKETTGVNFIHYLTNLRIEKAKRLLKDPIYKVSDVGENVGYENPRYFSKIFKKYTGMTPYEFRSNPAEENDEKK